MNEPARPEPPPPRYTQAGGWKHLVTDEPEWLARPARWGIEHLPEPRRAAKEALFDHHFYGRMTGWIACPVCRPLVRGAFAEDGIRIPDVLAVPQDDLNAGTGREKFRTWYSARHPDGQCEVWNGLKCMNYYECGIFTATELRNRLIDNLFQLAHQLDHKGRISLYRETHTAWERELALELVGPNPFRPITFDPCWLTSISTAVARTMYESRDFSAMPVLADALQDAGCDHAEVLDHCRGPGPHVRGCWVVDAILVRE